VKLGLLLPRGYGAALRFPSGGDVYDTQLAHALERRGHSVELVHTAPRMDARRLAEQLLACGYDLLLEDELGHENYLALNCALRARLAAFALVHVTSARLMPGARSAARERAFVESVRGSVFVSRQLRRETQRLLGVRLRSVIVHPGCDHLPRAIQRTAGKRVRFLALGHLLPHKGQLELIELFARVAGRWSLVVAGDDAGDRAYAARVRRAAERVGASRVRVVGPLRGAHLAAAFARADVCVSASRYESYGMALAEAISRGLPVVSWTEGGPWEFLTSGVNAIKVAPGDGVAFARAVTRLCDDPRLLERLQRGARASARHLPTWDMAAATLEPWLLRSLRAAA
jgi:glycosyltransferase involved in cell wall biosynthesis